MRILASVLVASMLLTAPVFASPYQISPDDTYVHGYERNNGTYVEPYYRSAPNSSRNDNYGTYKPYEAPAPVYREPSYGNDRLPSGDSNTYSPSPKILR